MLVISMLIYIAYQYGVHYMLTHPGMDLELALHMNEVNEISEQVEHDPVEAESKLDMLVESLPPDSKLKRWYSMGYKSAVTDVTFNGKVVDQNGLPVESARVSYFISGQFMASGSGSGKAVTDKGGHFSLRGQGAAVVIQSIVADDIDYNTPAPEQPTQLSRGRNPALTIENWDQYTPDNPYLFRAWRVDSFENVRNGSDGYGMTPDGGIYAYDPFVSNRGGRWKASKNNGMIRVSCERGKMSHERDYQDWRITLSPVDGGIQPTDDIYMNQAPESGYQASIAVQQSVSSPDFSRASGNHRYFFTAHNGKYYGSLIAHFRPHFRDNECSVRFSYKINMDGGRNLAIRHEDIWK